MTHNSNASNALLLAGFLCIATACAKPSVEVLAVANDGFLIRSANHTVMVDALFRATAPYPTFAQQGPSENLIDLMVSGGGAFEHVDLVLISSAEDDQFHAQTVVDFLQSHDESVLVATEEVQAALSETADAEAVSTRIIAPKLNGGQCTSIEAGEIPIVVCRTSNSGDTMANNAYIVEIDGFALLHEGGAEPGLETIKHIPTPVGGLDLAFLGQQFVFEPNRRTILAETINPRAVIVMHHRWDAAKSTRKRLAELEPEIAESLPPITIFGAETARSTYSPAQ